jgi:hypothetical protein
VLTPKSVEGTFLIPSKWLILKKGETLQQKSLRLTGDTFTRVLSVQNSWMKGQPHNLANVSTIPVRTRIPAIQQLKQACSILYVMQPTSSKSGLHARDKKFNTKHE